MAALIQTSAKLVGSPLSSMWAQVATLSSPHYDSPLGKLIIVTQITRTDDEEAAFFGKSLLDTVQNAYFAKEHDSIFTALNRGLTQVEELLHREGDKIVNPGFLAFACSDNKMYAGKVGRGRVALFRKGSLVLLLTQEHTLQTVSGIVAPGDYIILGTESFFEHAYPTSELFDEKNSPQEITDILSPVLLSLPQNADIAAFICAFSNQATEHAAVHELKAVSAPPTHAVPEFSHPLDMAGVSTLDKSPLQPPAKLTRHAKIVVGMRQVYQNARPVLYALTSKTKIMNARSRSHASLDQTQQFHVHGGIVRIGFLSIKLRRSLMLAITIAAVLALAFFGIRTFLTSRAEAHVKQSFELAAKHVAVAQSVKTQDPKRALALLEEARNAVIQARSKKANVIEPSGLFEHIESALAAISASARIENPETLFDVHLVKDTFSGSKVEYSGGTFLAVDAKAPTVVQVDKDKKAGVIVTGGEKVPGFVSATRLGEETVVLTQDGVFRINTTSGDAARVIAKDAAWGTVSDIALYAGNIYVLDAANKQIWKYTKEAQGYAPAKNVIADTDKGTFVSDAKDFVIDGAIWVVGTDAIVRVVNGKIQKYAIENLVEPFGANVRITTSLESKNMYMLDKDKNRIVVATKEGQYVSQYTSKTFAEVQDLAVDETAKELYLLTESKILKIPLQ